MKNILAFLLVLVLMTSACAVGAFAAELKAEAEVGVITVKDELSEEVYTSDEGYMYRLKPDGTAVVCGAPEGVEDIVIPKKVDGHKVIGLTSHNQRFQGAPDAKTFTVPEGVLTITGYVLTHLNNVETINMPSSIVHIDFQSFFVDTAYGKNPDNWDNGVMYIGTNLIAVKQDVPETLVVREGTTCVADSPAIYGNTVIKEIVFPKNFVYGLNGLTNSYLEKATVPAELGVVTAGLFAGCENLTDVTIEDGVTAIENDAFAWCKGLTSIEIPESVTHIGEDAFVTCEKLKKIYVPASVTSIDEHAFGYERYSYYDRDTSEYYAKYRPYNGFVLCGEVGSEANEYAQANNIPFVVSNDESAPVIPTRDEACFGKVGDANTDADVNIKDSTAIQKYLASLDELSANGLVLADADNDGVITIKDATVIQKYIAGLDTDTEVGDATDLRIYYHVYAKIGEDWIWTKDETHYFHYYKNEYGDMIAHPGIAAEFDAIVGGWGAYIPADANYVCFSVWEYDTVYMPLPECDGMMMIPSDSVGVYMYDCSWQPIN